MQLLDDLTQEVFIQAWRSLPRFKGKIKSGNHRRISFCSVCIQYLLFTFEKGKEATLPVSDAENPESILIRHEQDSLI